MKLTLMWPPELIITESMFRHFTGLAEIGGYLKNNSDVFRNSDLNIQIFDCSVKPCTPLNLAVIAKESIIICVYVNMNNVIEALKLIAFLKSVNKNVIITVYGEAATCNPIIFNKLEEINYVISNGQIEYAIEYIIIKEYQKKLSNYYDLKESVHYNDESIIRIGERLPSDKWGITDFEITPIKEYLEMSKGELHLLVNKGCPFFCEFCNERIVASNIIQYRDQDNVVDFICDDYSEEVKSVYLDSSTFTYDKEWVLELCEKLRSKKKRLKWKTCTRLDCIDEELILHMSQAGCERISIGVETFNKDIQEVNKKEIDENKLLNFIKCCRDVGIKPRALFIIGFKGQSKEDIDYAKQFCIDHSIDGRFRVLQDYSVLIECNDIRLLEADKLDRWNTVSPIDDMDIYELRAIEYPIDKAKTGNYV